MSPTVAHALSGRLSVPAVAAAAPIRRAACGVAPCRQRLQQAAPRDRYLLRRQHSLQRSFELSSERILKKTGKFHCSRGLRRPPAACRATAAASPLDASRDATPRATKSSSSSASQSPAATAASQAAVARPSRTPHSGYHYDSSSSSGGGDKAFFEGWYFKVTVPDGANRGDSFAWMYSVENPSAPPPATPADSPAGSPASSATCADGEGKRAGGGVPCVMMQVMGPAVWRQAEWRGGEGEAGSGGVEGGSGDGPRDYVFQEIPSTERFWGESHELALGTCFRAREGQAPPMGEIPPLEFDARVEHGFQVTPFLHQGTLKNQEDGSIVRWLYQVNPVDGWGPRGGTQLSTAGWLAALPAFEPHWQVCMAMGRATGWVEWRGQRIHFTDAITYSEKNWGGAFPLKWFWIQCNVFSSISLGSSVSLTVAGARRQLTLPLVPPSVEEVAMVGLHWEGQFIEFVPNRGAVEWHVQPWGRWWIRAENDEYEVTVEAHTLLGDEGTPLRAPTAEGMKIFCRDSFDGRVKLQLRQRYSGQLLLEAESTMAAVEVGGGPWWEAWKQRSRMNAARSAVISLPLNLSSILPPFLQPPGL